MATESQDVASGDQQRFLGEATSWLSLLNHSTSSHESSSVESGSDDVASVTTKCPNNTRQQKARKGPAKRRRTTYDIRKQQKNDLLTEIAKLEKQLNLLKDRALLEQGGESTTIQRTEIANSVLRECSQEQHVMIAGMQARLVAHMQKSLSAQYPTQTEIRLGTDRIQRRKALLDVKARKLCEAKRFIRTWGQGLDTNSTFSQENQFEALDGGFSVIRFDNAPILGTTVKNVFDAIIHSMQNAEIMISEMFGSISIREDTDFNASDIFQIRLVSSTPRGAVVESNSVVFAEYVEGPEDTYGIIASDFVDADELYPYIPSERVRRDSVTIVLVRSVKTSDKQEVVVGTRWTCLNLAHTELDIPKEGIRELQETSMAWGDTVKKCIMQYIANNQKLG